MSFYIKTTSTGSYSNTYTDYYSVMLSTGTNAINQFTTTVVPTTRVTSTSYIAVDVDLSSYSGQGYVAIRHTAAADQASLLVDDITIVEGEAVNPGYATETYTYGQTCVATATPSNGYHFVNWTENGTAVSSNATYSFTVTADRNLVANFSQQTQNYTISVSANPANGGTVTGGGTFAQGQSCTVVASPNANYTFTNWTENGNVVSTNASYTFTVTSNRTLVANFTAQTYIITVSADPTNGGIVTGGGTFNYGQSCTVTATANEGYVFHHWLENGDVVTTSASYAFTVTGDRNLVAIFTPHVYTIFAVPNPPEGGSTSGEGTYDYGQTCTVVATANEGYDFVNWTEDDNPVSDEESYSFTVTSSRMLTANFMLKTFDVKVFINPEEAGSVTGEGTYNYGDEVTLTVVRNEDWAFQNWTENGEVVWEELTYTFTVTRDHNLEANFLYTEGIGENSISAKVYPNPTQGEITLEGEGLSHVRIVNAYGQTVYNSKVEGDQVRIDLSNIAKGIYMMHIEAEGGQTVRKIVME